MSKTLVAQLYDTPNRFDFFQAVRLLEWINHEIGQTEPKRQRYSVGYDRPAEKEVTYFRAISSLQFPASQIARFVWRSLADGKELPPQMIVTFMGLTGPSGVLPVHYTRELLNRIHAKDYAMREFLDLFNHRSIAFFYRAWEKYRFYIQYEKSRRDGTEDNFTQALRSVTGLTTQALQERGVIPDDHLLFYAGFFSQQVRNATSLGAMLGDYFSVPVQVKQFVSERTKLHKLQRTQLVDEINEVGQYDQLGVNAVLGAAATQSQHRFRIIIGPLNYAQFKRFLPNNDTLAALRDMTQHYVGLQYSFDVQLILRNYANMGCRLFSEVDPEPTHLGWNTWLTDRARHDRDDLILEL